MKNEDTYWIDSLRVLATISVIFIHVVYEITDQFQHVSNYDWWVGNIFNSSLRFCVPIFLMISGALILPKTYESIGEFLKKRLIRIILPFLFWSFIYIAKDIFLQFSRGDNISFSGIFMFIFFQLKNGACFHFWYINMIIGLYLFFPIIGKWINKSNKNEILYFIIIWLFTILVKFPFFDKFLPNFKILYFSGFIGFPVLGYFLYKNTFTKSNREILISVLFILTGILITVFGTFFFSKQDGKINDEFYAFLTPNVILASTGVFLLYKNTIKFNAKISSIILFLSKYSYGTFLVHIFVLWILLKFGIYHSFVNPIIGIPITGILCFIISTLIIFGVNKLPFGKYISG